MVRAPVQSAAPSKKKSGSSSSAATKGPRAGQIPDLESVDADSPEVFAPSESPTYSGGSNPFADIDKRLIYGIGGGIAVMLLFGLYVIFRPNNPDSGSTPPPPPPNSTVATVTPQQPPTVPTVSTQPATEQIAIDTNKPQATTLPAWMSLKPVVPKLAPKPITDQLVENSIRKAVNFLKTLLVNNELVNPDKDHPDSNDLYAGEDTLVVYSLLHAGEAINDSELSISNQYMRGLLERLKHFDMKTDKATYDRSLRACALAMFERNEDKAQLQLDKAWLQSSEVLGAYNYSMPPKGADPNSLRWDNSNSQYGVLGMWAAALAGEDVSPKYWADVEKHWIGCQTSDGGWAYQDGGGTATITMTCAGVTTLCVSAEQQEIIASKGKKDQHVPMTKAINKALDWMGKDDHLIQFGGEPGYALYGVERAALATGYRWFGDHDWFRELGAREIKNQGVNGSWGGDAGGDGQAAETAFRVLFLSRGRQPLLMDKLRFDGDWNDRPRDVSKLAMFASSQLEKPFAWGVADLSRNWWDWLESPLLFMSTDTPPHFTDEDCTKLRSYTDAGGLLFIHNEYATKEVDQFVQSLARRLYPEYPLVDLPPDSLFYSAQYPMKKKPPLKAVGNGTRTFLVYSPTDITPDWVRFKPHDTRARENPDLQMGMNLFVSAAGLDNFRNRLNSPWEEPCTFEPIGTVPFLRLTYPAARGSSRIWNAEPMAFVRFGRWFQNQTSIALDVQPTDVLDINAKQGPVAVLSGNAAYDFHKLDFKALNKYVSDGGVLLIESTGGNKDFAASVKDTLMPTAFPGITPSPMPASHPILAGTGACMDPLPRPLLKPFATRLLMKAFPDDKQDEREARAAIQYANVGKGTIIISDLDITTGLLNSGTFGINGFTPAYDQSLVKNVILWALSRYHRSVM